MNFTDTDAQALDLDPTPGPRWGSLDIPAGWEPVAALCRQIADQPDELVSRMVDAIRAEIPAYARTTSVITSDLRMSVARNLEMTLVGMAERRGPRPDELRVRRELGNRRATQELPVDALLQAFLVGYRLFWDELVARSQKQDSPARDLLLSAAATVWQWVHEVTEAVASAYQDRVRRAEALALTRQHRLIDELRNGDLSSGRAADLAREAGFDPHGSFRVACAPIPDGLQPDLRARQRNSGRGHQLRVEIDHTMLIIGQGLTAEDALSTIQLILGDAPAGIGMQRAGLAGARTSLGDAERALVVSRLRGEPCCFEERWLAATLLPTRDRLAELFSPGYAAIDRYPDLAATVAAFAESGLSQSAAARKLGIHSNTAGYRLTRWSEITGWDPRSGTGLTLSLAALETHHPAGQRPPAT